MCELLEQDGREIEIAVERDVVAVETVESAQQREIGFGCGLEEPLDAMWPTTVIDDVREMRVKRQSKESTRLWRWLSHSSQSLGAPGRPAQVGGAG
jgi:hypothetical protein